MTVDPNLLPNFQGKKLVRCADCLWWSVSDQGYRCSFDGEIVTRRVARTREHPCPFYIDREKYLEDLRGRVWDELSKPVDG